MQGSYHTSSRESRVASSGWQVAGEQWVGAYQLDILIDIGQHRIRLENKSSETVARHFPKRLGRYVAPTIQYGVGKHLLGAHVSRCADRETGPSELLASCYSDA